LLLDIYPNWISPVEMSGSYTSVRSVNENDADELFSKAEKKAKSAQASGIRSLFGLGGNAAKLEEAAELFVKAGNTFKLAKVWQKAGDAYMRAAENYAQLPDLSFEAASKFADAARCFKNVNSEDAIVAMQKAMEMYTKEARFQQGAKTCREIAELYENMGETVKAAEAYEQAADLYDGEDAKSHANQCRAKVAEFAALAGDFNRAIDLFEKVASVSLENKLLRYGAKEFLLRAGLCRVCLGDEVGASRALEKYKSLDSSFNDSREAKLLEKVILAVQENDEEAFTDAVAEYDSLSKLDPWKTSILLKIKKNLKAQDEDLT
jgi:alpha-soluble NSF attachment protein